MKITQAFHFEAAHRLPNVGETTDATGCTAIPIALN